MVLGGNDRNPTINNQSMTSMADMMNMANVLKVKLGTTEIWNLVNRSGDTHAFHVHDIQFQMLDRSGGSMSRDSIDLGLAYISLSIPKSSEHDNNCQEHYQAHAQCWND